MASRKITFANPINTSLQVTDLIYAYSDGNVLDNPTMAGITQAASSSVDSVTGLATGWTTPANWTIGSNKLTASSATTDINTGNGGTIGLKDGITYTATYTLSGVSGGSVRLVIYGNSGDYDQGTTRDANGTYTETLVINHAGSGAYSQILFETVTSFTGSIENIFISPVSTTKDTKVIHLLGKVTAIDRTLNTVTYLEDSKSPTVHADGFTLFSKNKNINQNGVKGRYASVKIENNATTVSKITDLAVGVIESSK